MSVVLVRLLAANGGSDAAGPARNYGQSLPNPVRNHIFSAVTQTRLRSTTGFRRDKDMMAWSRGLQGMLTAGSQYASVPTVHGWMRFPCTAVSQVLLHFDAQTPPCACK